jgi:ABC-2 type transport system permease protein
MSPILALAWKDLRLLFRNRGHLFFAFGWPVVMALSFGLIFGGGGRSGAIPVVIVDEDGTPASAELVGRLRRTEGLEVVLGSREEGERLVRQGKRSAAVVVPKGYGEASDRLFYGEPRKVEIALDPSRTAEAAMLEGLLTGAAMQSFQQLFGDPSLGRKMVDRSMADLRKAGPARPERQPLERFLGELDTFLGGMPTEKVGGERSGSGRGWTPLVVEKRKLGTERVGPRTAFEVTFPQGVLWGVIGCALGFALSLVSERTHGTLKRLQMSPLSRGHVLAGKALACFASIALVEVLLFAVGRVFLGVRPSSWALLALAGFAVALAFVGIMMVVAVAGRTEQSAGGLGWSIMMPLTMLGGGMVPLFVMPRWMQAVGTVSPVKWGILAMEGAIWRGFGLAEMLLPCGVLAAVGLAAFALGARLFRGD